MIVSAKAVRQAMTRREFSVVNLAKSAKIPAYTVSRLSRGNQNLQMRTLARLAKALGVDAESLIVSTE